MAGDGERLVSRLCRLLVSFPSSSSSFSGPAASTLEINENVNAPGNRVQFQITKTSEKEPNNSTVTVTNLNDEHRAALQQKGVKLILEAGYVATGVARIHIGDVRTVDPVRDGSDWNSIIRLGDGERAYRYARVRESFAPGVGAGDVLRYLGAASGLQIGNIPDVVLNLTTIFDQGYAVSGRWADEMDRLLRGLGYKWSIQDETLQVLLPNSSIGGEVPEISPTSGLIGSPEMGSPEKKGKPALVKFKALLFPTKPNARVKLKSEKYNGFVRVKKATYTGDTRGGPWYVDIEGVNLG